MPRKKTVHLDRTSSLNKHFICDRCDSKYATKNTLRNHPCFRSDKNVPCKWCNVTFNCNATLANHAWKVHSDMSYSKLSKMDSSQIFKCDVCSKMFAEMFQLRYHIRRQHFNMRAKMPYWLQKRVNQVWFENVRNGNNVVEIRKAGPNVLVMRKLAESTAIRVADHDTEEVDVTHLYPTGRGKRYEPVECKICTKMYDKRSINKHIEEVHYNKTRHRCNKCNMRFKRSYIFLQHVCSSARKPRGVRHQKGGVIKIAAVESMAPFGNNKVVGGGS